MKEFRTGDIVVSDDTIVDLLQKLEIVGVGSYRTVYQLNDTLVVKVPRTVTLGRRTVFDGGRIGYSNNLAEAEFWRNCDADISELIAGVIMVSDTGAWIIMEKADSVLSNGYKTADDKTSDEDYSHLCNVMSGIGIQDTHEANIGIFGDKLRVIDYGE